MKTSIICHPILSSFKTTQPAFRTYRNSLLFLCVRSACNFACNSMKRKLYSIYQPMIIFDRCFSKVTKSIFAERVKKCFYTATALEYLMQDVSLWPKPVNICLSIAALLVSKLVGD